MARPVYPTSEQIWTKAKAYKSTYFDDQNAILKDSIERARKQLLDKYNANLAYVGYQKDLIKVYQDNLSRMQDALNEYDKNKTPGKGGVDSGAAALLNVAAKANGDKMTESGKSSQRRLDAMGLAEAAYNLTPTQSNAIGDASSLKGVDLQNATSPADVQRIIDNAVSAIPGGTFAPNADSSKTATSQLFAALNAGLSGNSVYATNPTLQKYLKDAVKLKMGVDEQFLELQNVNADKMKKVKKTGDVAAQYSGAGTADDIVKRVYTELDKDKQAPMSAADKTVADAFTSSNRGIQYKMYVDRGYTLDQARQIVADSVGREEGGEAQAKFMSDFSKAQDALGQGGDWDIFKYYDTGYVDKLAAVKKTQGSLTEAEQGFATGVRGLQDIPTEQQARRLGAEINRPLEPGYKKYLPEAQANLARAKETGTMRNPLLDMAGNPYRTADDYLASRLMPPQPAAKQMSDAERVTQLATRRAVADSPNFDYNSAGDGFGLYNKVKGKALEGGNSKENIVKAAAALAGDDQAKRDDILRDYYTYALRDMRATKPQGM
jgi:hypothetical protein